MVGNPRVAGSGPAPSPGEGSAPAAEGWGWTGRQRVGLGILLGLLVGFLVVQYVRRPARLEDPVVMYEGEAMTLPRRLDPNTATELELMRIPQLAEKLAGKIVEYRTARRGLVEDGIVFRQPEDLGHVPGLGKAALEQLRPYLQFPEDTAETQPGL